MFQTHKLKQDPMVETGGDSLFRYKCPSCNEDTHLIQKTITCECPLCDGEVKLLPGKIIQFYNGQSEQTERFDAVYASGNLFESSGVEKKQTYAANIANAVGYVKSAGIDIENDFTNLDVLEVACGAGWVTAGILQTPAVRDCRFQAFDISPHGPQLLSDFFDEYKKSSDQNNSLELSTQDANSMNIGSNSFDLILGSSTLHHFDDYETHLRDIHRALKDGGLAVYSEPLALGHALTAIAAKIATSKLNKEDRIVDYYYDNIRHRITNRHSKGALRENVDKHVFFIDDLTNLAKEIGFSEVRTKTRREFKFFSSGTWIDTQLRQYRVTDDELISEAKSVYKVISDMFGEAGYRKALLVFEQFLFVK